MPDDKKINVAMDAALLTGDAQTASKARASKASAAWYEYMLRGGQPRVMSPMDEFSWFESIQATNHRVLSADGVVEIVGLNPRRVGLVFAHSSEDVYAARVPVHAGVFSGTISGGTTILGATANDAFEVPIGGNAFWLWPGQPPVGDIIDIGIPLFAGQPPLRFTQHDFGPLCQCQWSAQFVGGASIFVCEILLREFPKQ